MFDLPDGSVIRAMWDLRDCVDDYLGRLDYTGKSVIEIGPASGFLTVSMEKRGAHVVSIDNAEDEVWEYVPRTDLNIDQLMAERRKGQERVYKSWWYSQKAFGCSAKVVYCGVRALQDIARSIRPQFDICLISGVLQHVRYPVDVLWAASRFAKTVVVTERLLMEVERPGAFAKFVPAPDNHVTDTWWYLSSTTVTNAMTLFGLEKVSSRDFNSKVWKKLGPNEWSDTPTELSHRSMVFTQRG
jgi:O-methyltransferase